MKENKTEENAMIEILRESGLDIPSESFSHRLRHLAIKGYRRNLAVESHTEKRLGKIILFVLVLFNLCFFVSLNPFIARPELFMAIAAFIIGLWILIVLIKKSVQSAR